MLLKPETIPSSPSTASLAFLLGEENMMELVSSHELMEKLLERSLELLHPPVALLSPMSLAPGMTAIPISEMCGIMSCLEKLHCELNRLC
jgi:hypothetical protein